MPTVTRKRWAKVERETPQSLARVAPIVLPTRAEEGCVSFTFNQSVQDPTEFSVVEVWRSRADADKHGETPHMKKCLDAIGKMFAPGYPILKSYENLDETFEE
jgi:quinol monooxygenase YgiN